MGTQQTDTKEIHQNAQSGYYWWRDYGDFYFLLICVSIIYIFCKGMSSFD